MDLIEIYNIVSLVRPLKFKLKTHLFINFLLQDTEFPGVVKTPTGVKDEKVVFNETKMKF